MKISLSYTNGTALHKPITHPILRQGVQQLIIVITSHSVLVYVSAAAALVNDEHLAVVPIHDTYRFHKTTAF